MDDDWNVYLHPFLCLWYAENILQILFTMYCVYQQNEKVLCTCETISGELEIMLSLRSIDVFQSG